MKGQVTEYMARADGTQMLGMEPIEGVRVTIDPTGPEYQKRARQLAVAITDAALEQEAQRLAINAVQSANETLSEQLHKARARISELEALNAAASSGRRRFFGAVLMRPCRPGDWSGEVWLLDPVKQERGTGLRFASVSEVREMHPELWVVSAVDDGVLLDAWGTP